MLKTYNIRASEIVFYNEDIKATSEKEAIEIFQNSILKPCDSDSFQVDHVIEYKKQGVKNASNS
jgi:hypothetical protein